MLFLVSCAQDAGLTPLMTPPASPERERLSPPADRRLIPFLGDWRVEGTIYTADGSAPTTLRGEARIEPGFDGRSVHESLVLDGFESETVLGYSPARGRYELTQIDNTTGGQVWLVGLWSADGRTLELSVAEDGQLRGLGFAEMVWTYAFNQDGQLVKTIRVRDVAGGVQRTQSSYVYTRR